MYPLVTHHPDQLLTTLLSEASADTLHAESQLLAALHQLGHPTPALAVQRALHSGLLRVGALHPAGGTRHFARATPGAGDYQGPPACYAPPAAYEQLGPNEYFPALPAEVSQYRARARFRGQELGELPRWHTLRQLVARLFALWNPGDRVRAQRFDPAVYWLTVGFGQCRPAPDGRQVQASGLGALRVSFGYAATADAVHELLTHDYYLGGHLLLLWGTREPYGLLALMRLPGGYAQPAAALAAVAGYVQHSYQPAGLVCEALPLDAPVTFDGRSRCQWVHPSLEASFEDWAS